MPDNDDNTNRLALSTEFDKDMLGQRQPSMSSREIADLLGCRHDNVRRTIERLSERGVIQLPPLEEIATGARAALKYMFSGERGKRDSYVVVAQLCPEFTARLVDRWQELEAQQRQPSVGSKARTDVSREYRLTMQQTVRWAKMAGLSGNQALLAANQATVSLTGIDTLGLLGVKHLEAPQNEPLLTPSDIGQRLGISARAVNLLLCDRGLQDAFRDAKSHVYYEPTEDGVAAGGVMQDTGKRHSSGTPVRQLRWASSIIGLLERQGQLV